jgi:hypothetical protein
MALVIFLRQELLAPDAIFQLAAEEMANDQCIEEKNLF